MVQKVEQIGRSVARLRAASFCMLMYPQTRYWTPSFPPNTSMRVCARMLDKAFRHRKETVINVCNWVNDACNRNYLKCSQWVSSKSLSITSPFTKIWNMQIMEKPCQHVESLTYMRHGSIEAIKVYSIIDTKLLRNKIDSNRVPTLRRWSNFLGH